MDCISTRLPYRQTGAFSKIALDYIDQAAAIKPFFNHPPTIQGIQKTIEERKQFPTNRELLVEELKKQYEGVNTSAKVKKNIESLLSADSFTITTAHQNNIFTGPLYFIYKIVHAIKLADNLKASLPENNFVPVFYIGTEDADLDELNHIYLGGEKLVWETKQTGAVGRMKVDKIFNKLIDLIEGQLSVLPNGNEIVSQVKEFYTEGTTIQDATFRFVNSLFAKYGLVILLPDNAVLKKQMSKLFEDDLHHQTASSIVEKSASKLSKAGYKVQANPREINLFYLKDDRRDRIEKISGEWRVVNGSRKFSETEILKELQEHPERFSPNVILRGLYQETILPNIAFIGGGGEIAYWLQLKDLFEHYKIPFPVLVLRNSFLLVEKKWQERISHLGFTVEDFFLPEQELLNRLVAKDSKKEMKLNGSLTELEQLYENFKKQATAVDSTLEKHVDALKANTVFRLQELEKKMLRAEKRKFADQQGQIHTIKEQLFPANGLQERRENLSYYYAKWGSEFISKLYEHSLGLEQEFVIVQEK
ncbi:MAG: bacillithiol biosynthesis cysteine-adding enzyme BshC [Bacteroidota bacterium]